MQIDTNADTADLVTAIQAIQDAADALEHLDVSRAPDAALELLVDREDIVRAELTRRGLRECGRCRVAKPGAVDWGCSCGKSADELNAEAVEFARIHD